MDDNKTAIDEVKKLLEAQSVLNGGWQIARLENLQSVADWRDRRLQCEREFGLGTEKEQQEWFAFMYCIYKESLDRKVHSVGFLMFDDWSGKTENTYAVTYRAGWTNGMNAAFERADRDRKRHIDRAANGRRLIGATTRAKVAKEADKLRHNMTKSDAAYAIAEIVKKDSGTIKRYLTELFPGDKWKTTNQ